MTHFNGNLEVTVLDVIEVPSQYASKQDPYCVVTLGSSGPKRFMEGAHFGKEKFQTQVAKGNLERPVWNENHVLNLDHMTLDSHLKVKLFDKDSVKDDFVGEAKINLEDLLPQSKKGLKYYPLCKWTKLYGKNRQECVGQVGIAVAFDCTEIPQTYFDRKVGDAAIRRAQGVNSEGAEGTTTAVSEPRHLEKPIAHVTRHDINLPAQTDVAQNGQTGVTQYGQLGPQHGQTSATQPQQKGAMNGVDQLSQDQVQGAQSQQ